MRIPAAIAATFLAALSACASASHQLVAMPDPASAVRPDTTRIYVGRRDQTAGSWRNVQVFDNEREIGVLHDGEYLCWDRPARQGTGRFIFDVAGFEQDMVEGVCELPAVPGGTVYLGITIARDTRKPTVERVSAAEGQAALARRTPASTEKK